MKQGLSPFMPQVAGMVPTVVMVPLRAQPGTPKKRAKRPAQKVQGGCQEAFHSMDPFRLVFTARTIGRDGPGHQALVPALTI